MSQQSRPWVDVGTIVESGGWSAYQLRVLSLTTLAIILDGFDNQVAGFAMPSLLADLKIQRSAMAPVLAAALLGMTAGSALAGWYGDRVGRRKMLVFCVLFFGMTTLAAAMSHSVMTLTVLRFLAGCGLGGAMPNAVALIVEYAPKRHKLLAVSFAAVCVPLGGIFGGVIAAQILPLMGWRALFVIGGGAPVLFALILFRALPESPRFLARIGDPHGQLPRLLARMDKRIEGEVEFVDGSRLAGGGQSGATLFGAGHRRNSAALWIAFFACLFAVYSTVNWLPTLMMDRGFSLEESSYALIFYNVGSVVAALGGGWLSGRLNSNVPATLLALIGVATAALLTVIDQQSGNVLGTMLVLLTIWGAASAGCQSVLTALASAIYPTEIRATGVGSSIGFGRLGGIAGASLGAAYLATWGAAGFFYAQAIAMGVLAASTAALRFGTPTGSSHPSSASDVRA